MYLNLSKLKLTKVTVKPNKLILLFNCVLSVH